MRVVRCEVLGKLARAADFLGNPLHAIVPRYVTLWTSYIAGLTDFGPGRSRFFGNSADEYLKVHHLGLSQADVTEGSDVTRCFA
jgi:hypothetical protein